MGTEETMALPIQGPFGPGFQPPKPPALEAEDLKKSEKYFEERLIHKDAVLDYALENGAKNGLPTFISVDPLCGKFLKLVAQSIGAKRILEVGTLAGYSTICMARTLPADGKLVTLELFEKNAQVAQANVEKAGLQSKVEIKVGPAIDSMRSLSSDEPFDFVFVDADKKGTAAYWAEAKRLTRKGGVIIVDNVNIWGKVALEPEDTDDPSIIGVRQCLQQLKMDKEVDVTELPLASSFGFDGMLYAVKL